MELQRERFPDRKLPWIAVVLAEEVLRLEGEKVEGIFRWERPLTLNVSLSPVDWSPAFFRTVKDRYWFYRTSDFIGYNDSIGYEQNCVVLSCMKFCPAQCSGANFWKYCLPVVCLAERSRIPVTNCTWYMVFGNVILVSVNLVVLSFFLCT